MSGDDGVADKKALQIRIAVLESELEQAKAELRFQHGSESHISLSDAIEAMSEGVALFDADDRHQIYNQQYLNRFSGAARNVIQPGVTFDEIVAELTKHWSTADDSEDLAKSAIDRHHNLPSEAEINYSSGLVIRQSKKRTNKGGVLSIFTDITDLKSREQAIRDSELRHRLMLEALPDAVVISVDAKIVFVNAAALEMFGAKDAAELVGRDAHSLAPADLRGSQRARRQKVLAEQCTLPPTEQKRVRLDGTLFDVETVATFMMWEGKSAFIGVLRDITARKAAELNLAETERRLSAVADHILGAVYQQVQSPDGTVTFSYVSAGVCEVTGLMPEQIIDDPAQFIDTIREDFRGQYRAHFRKSAADLVPSDFEFPIIRQDGCLRWIHTSGRPQRRVDGTVVWDGVMFDVTDKKIAQENAERNHQWLLQAIDSMPTGFMLWDTDDRLVLWNNLASSYHHDPAMFREGLSFEDMLQLPYEDRKRHLGVDGADEWLVERREQHKAADGNYEFQGKNNSWFTLRERTTPDGFTVTMVSDVSDLYDSRTLLQESEERYRAMINLSPDAIYVHKQGIIAVCNEAAIELFGAESSDELIGRELLELTHPEHREAARKRRSSVVEEGTRTLVMRQKRLRLDGSWFWAEVAAAAINWEGERGGVVVLRDVTAQIASEDELIRSKEAAELANRAKTEFLANISHELRTPLNAIIGFSDLMQREMLGPLGNEQYASYIGDIHQSGTHLHDVINDILDLSKIEAGQMELQESSVDVLGAIERCIRVVAARAADSGLTLTTQLPESLPYVVADERKLKQIFINLMSNAVKFTGRGGTITVAARSDPQEGVSIEIADTGIGIADDDIPKVFRAFEQVDSSLSRTHEGTGLGLPLTKSLVELHGGTLTLQSQIDAGTTITVSLPADRISSKPLAAE